MNPAKLTAVITKDENGDDITVEIATYIKELVTEYNVKEISTDKLKADPKKIVEHIINSVVKEKDIDETVLSEAKELVDRITQDIQYTRDNTKSKAEEAKEAKEAKEKAKAEEKAAEEKKKQELVKKQEGFVSNVAAGANLAAEEFKDELTGLASHMPEGIKVVNKGSGYGVEVAAGATADTVGAALGYMMQKSQNSQFIGNQLQFWVGDIVNHTVALGVYTNASEANKLISKMLEEKYGKKLTGMNIDAYKRMADRTPIELRNPRADATAYLAISNMKLPKKNEKESDEDFKKRTAAFEEDRKSLQEKLAKGEVTARKDILDPVNEVLYKHGLKERPSENSGPSVVGWLQIFFHSKFALDNLDGSHEEDMIVYKDGENTVKISTAEMQEKFDEAYTNLANIYYSTKKGDLTPKDYSRGFVEKEVEVEVGKDGDGKPIKAKEKVKNYIFPEPFFPAPKKEEEETKEETKEEAKA